jgi:ankyrin repeat protein/Tfp pilus assembly protein PilF
MKDSEELREQLFLTLFLTAVREKEVKIINLETYKKIAALGNFPEKKKLQYFSGIIDHYRTAPLVRRGRQNLRAKNRRYVDISLFDVENSPLDLYLYLFCLNYYSFDFGEQDEQLAKLMQRRKLSKLMIQYSQSPLFIFSNIGMSTGKEAEIEEKYPQFAEFFQHRGNVEYEERQLIKASHYYKKTLELIPDYTIALNGLGNIYYFTVQNYDKAIEFYAKTLALDSKNPVALFGEAVSLHNLEQYQVSHMVLDYMLSRQKMYHGQANYYKAYNYYYMGKFEKSREFVDKAKNYIPTSGEVNYLSGLLYYKNSELGKAEPDFMRALKDDHYPKGNPLFYLGMINLRSRNWIFFDYFRDSIRSLERIEDAKKREIAQIDALHIQDKLKEWMKWNRKIKLKKFQKSSLAMIKQMTTILAANKENHSKEGGLQLHSAAVKGKLDRVRALVEEGTNLNARDREGYTALHRAVLMGKKEVAKFLIEKGAAVDTALPGGYTPLHEAAYNGHKEIVALLIAKGAAIYAADAIGKTPLQLAAAQGHNDLLPILRPLHTAVEKGDAAVVQSMLSREPALLNVKDEKGRTPLYLAVTAGHKELARQLIDRGAELDTTESDGTSLLNRVRQKGFKELAELLAAKGIELSDKDLLEKELGPGEAVIWHVRSSAWVVKTKNHVLIFDYTPVNFLWQRLPGMPFVAFGELNPGKISAKKIATFNTRQPMIVPDMSSIISWGKNLKNISYYFSWKPVNFYAAGMKPVTIAMNPGEMKNSGGIEVSVVKYAPPGSESSGAGFLIKTDGLTIYYAGDQTGPGESMWAEFSREIDNLASKEQAIDLLFIPASGAANSPVNKVAVYAIDKLNPRMMFPIQAGGEEYYYKEFARQLKSKRSDTLVRYAEEEGQRFLYKKR